MNIEKITTIFRAFHFEVEIQPIKLNLPIVFKKKYEFMTLIIKEKLFLLIKETRRGSLDNFVKQAQAIQKQLNQEVVLVFNQLSDEHKKHLLQIGMAYLDYQENTYLPQLGFWFSSVKPAPKVNKTFTSTEQKILIALLLDESTSGIDLDVISRLTGLAIPSLYRVFKGFKERGWLINKQKAYHFAKPKIVIFEEAQANFRNPIKETLRISDDDFQKLGKVTSLQSSYLQALSAIGMLAYSENYGNYAVSKKAYKKIEKEIQSFIFQGHRLEIWEYEPIPFDYKQNNWGKIPDEQLVDPISLYLTLKEMDDPRVEEALEALEYKILNLLGGNNAS